MDRRQIERYAEGADVPVRAIAGLTTEDLLATPVPGTWSIQQIILHLMDSDLIGANRMKRIAAEERPTLLGYDESAFGSKLGYEHLDVAMAAEVFRLNRLLTSEILRRQPDVTFRANRAAQRARYRETLSEMLRDYCDHLDHHMKFIHEKRGLLGKPL